MNEIIESNLTVNSNQLKSADFEAIYGKAHRLAAAVFLISNLIETDQELKTKIKHLSLELVSVSVNLKDIVFQDLKKSISSIEKNSLELVSMLEIASVSGLISAMNATILKEEFQSFIKETGVFFESFAGSKDVSLKSLLGPGLPASIKGLPPKQFTQNNGRVINGGNIGGSKRKDLRKNMVLEFVKGHSNASIKDIVPNIVGCSEKTVQRELIALINEGKIKKTGERRWSRYSTV